MGKQINYWMDYDNFLLLSQKALDLGCTIVKENLDQGRVIESESISLITPYETYSRTSYYFHLPEAGEIRILNADGKDYLDYGFTATGNAMIEADYSLIIDEPTGAAGIRRKKEIHRARIYCISGYYDENEKYIPRPDCLTNVYNSLARFIKKLAPSTKIPLPPPHERHHHIPLKKKKIHFPPPPPFLTYLLQSITPFSTLFPFLFFCANVELLKCENRNEAYEK